MELTGEGRLSPTDDRPLTDQEYQLLQRLLSDPFSIPVQFKAWLVSYLESSDMSLPISAIVGLTALLGISSVGGGTLGIFPAGIILPYGADTAPAGSKLCDGALYTQTVEARLYAAIGNRYANGRPAPPAGQFYVPDIQDRVPVGKGTQAVTDTAGKTEGLPLGQRSIEHRHITGREGHLLAPGGTLYDVVGTEQYDQPTTPTASPNVNRPAFITLNFIIIA